MDHATDSADSCDRPNAWVRSVHPGQPGAVRILPSWKVDDFIEYCPTRTERGKLILALTLEDVSLSLRIPDFVYCDFSVGSFQLAPVTQSL